MRTTIGALLLCTLALPLFGCGEGRYRQQEVTPEVEQAQEQDEAAVDQAERQYQQENRAKRRK